MAEGTKYYVMAALSIAALVISLAALSMSFQNAQTSVRTESPAATAHYTGEKREFWLFNSEIPEFNETKMGMPHDVYSMPVIAVYKGDKVVIHFFNTEEPGGDHHSFTLFDKPYNINVDLSPGQNTTFSFDANTTGIFAYYCTYHPPTMKGQLIVQPPPY